MFMIEDDFLAIINENSGIIHKICRLYRDSKEDREDLFQEITFQLWKAYPFFKENSKLSTWLYKIAFNTAVANYRKKRPSINYVPILPDYSDDKNEQDDRQEQLFAVIKQLNEGDRAILSLYFEELSNREIAEIIGISENNVSVKMNRIKQKIQKLLIK